VILHFIRKIRLKLFVNERLTAVIFIGGGPARSI